MNADERRKAIEQSRVQSERIEALTAYAMECERDPHVWIDLIHEVYGRGKHDPVDAWFLDAVRLQMGIYGADAVSEDFNSDRAQAVVGSICVLRYCWHKFLKAPYRERKRREAEILLKSQPGNNNGARTRAV